MSSSPTSFVCQQCKQPILLDASVTEVIPENIEDILPSRGTASSSSTPAQRLAQLNAPAAVKQAWETATSHKRESSQSTPVSATATASPSAANRTSSSNTRRTATATAASPSGAESFVLLQDSVVKKIPTTPTPSPIRPTPHSAASPIRNRSKDSANAGPATPSSRPTGPPSKRTPHGAGVVPSSSTAGRNNASPTSSPRTKENTPPIGTNNLHSTLRLFTLLSSRTELDHPLCSDCTSTLIESLERQLDETKRERDGYAAFEREVRKQREAVTSSSAGDEKKLEQKIERLEAEAAKTVADLRTAEKEKLKLEAELAALEEEEKALEEEEAEFWADQSRMQLIQARAQDTLNSLSAAIEHTQHELSNLARTNVYNDAFCIGHDGVFGTVNGLRLGRVGGVNVEWAEINAAWGQTLLLLHTIARKLEFPFETYRLVPMGSFSRIEKIQGDKGTYELYGSGDIHLTRILHNRRFDYAMVAFLDCLRQLMEHVKALDPSVDFPHVVVKDKIGEASIKLQFNQEEAWTRALRHVLLALKLLLKWATSG